MKHRVFGTAAVAAFLFTSLAPLGAPAADDAAALLAKHAAYVGWHAGDPAVPTIVMTGHVGRLVNGAFNDQASRISDVRRGVQERSINTTPKGVSYQGGFTGRVFWESNENGFTVPLNGDVVKYAVSAALIDNEATAGVPAALRGTAQVNGASVPIVRLSPANGVPVDVAIDPATGAFVRVALDPDGPYHVVRSALRYTQTGGKRVLTEWSYPSGRVVRYDDVKIGAPVSDDDLHPPAQTAHWTFGGPIPVRLTAYRVLLYATINGVRGNFMLDTGAASIALSDSFARRAHLEHIASARSYGVGGAVNTELQRAKTVALGDNTLSDVIVTTGVSSFEDPREGTIDGLLGYDLLAGAIVDLNLDAKQMRFLDPKKFAPGSDGIHVRLDLTQLVPVVPMKASGTLNVNALLDSGNPGWVLFSAADRSRVRFAPDPNAGAVNVAFGGVGKGYTVAECGRLDEIALGPIRYTQPTACAASGFGESGGMLLGLEFMRHFNLVFDYPDGEMLFVPRKDQSGT